MHVIYFAQYGKDFKENGCEGKFLGIQKRIAFFFCLVIDCTYCIWSSSIDWIRSSASSSKRMPAFVMIFFAPQSIRRHNAAGTLHQSNQSDLFESLSTSLEFYVFFNFQWLLWLGCFCAFHIYSISRYHFPCVQRFCESLLCVMHTNISP